MSFLEALKLPKALLEVIFELDMLLDRGERQYQKKLADQAKGKTDGGQP